MRVALVLAALLAFPACGPKNPAMGDDALAVAVEAGLGERHTAAASAAYGFMVASSPDDPRYDRAQRQLARSAEQLQLTWVAGTLYRDLAMQRRNAEVVPDALRGLVRVVESDVYDHDLLLRSFIAAEEIGFLPDDVKPFVIYHRGLDLTRRGLDEWAQEYFDSLPEDSNYAHRARYLDAVKLVAKRQDDAAIEILEELEANEALNAEMRSDVGRSLARMSFEHGDFTIALDRYEQLREEAPNDPEILLEMAWTHFYLGDSRKALGLLVALDAPVHASYIAPERYLLEAMALRRLCQFAAAREAAVRLNRRHGDALAAIKDGSMPDEVPAIREAARRRGKSLRNARYRDRLVWERERARGLPVSDDFAAYLETQYTRGIHEADLREDEELERDLLTVTEELLAAEEGVQLIIHELGVSMLRGRRPPPGAVERTAAEIPFSGETVFYMFSGEYWTDELDDFVVVAEDRCID